MQEEARGRHRRRRWQEGASALLPRLDETERALLCDWARGSAPSRPVGKLREVAGASRLDVVERLFDRLLKAGWIALDEQFKAGAWWPQTLHWRDLPALQQALGLPTEAERAEARAALETELQALLGAEDPQLRAAAEALRQARLPDATRRARVALLQHLLAWTQEQRRGLRQDFALFVEHTKALSEADWRWLEQQFDLEALGIGRFAALLWLAGDMGLQFESGRLDLSAAPFIGVPQQALDRLVSLCPPPAHYWLIENRASFERQAAQRAEGACIVWLPGRPSGGWCTAVRQLFGTAPAPVRISADADPAGIEIALAAGACCEAAGCHWEPHAMEAGRLDGPRPIALNTYDRATLQRLQARCDVPPPLRALAEAMEARGVKHEQEAWL